jgi:hypothetical protein
LRKLLIAAVALAAVAMWGSTTVQPSEASEPAAADVIVQASAAPAASPSATPSAAPSPMYQYSAIAQGSYIAAGASQLSFGVPILGANSGFPSRLFDTRPNTFTFNQLNLQASKSSAGVIGWKIELWLGNDANAESSANYFQLVPQPGQLQTANALCGLGPPSVKPNGPTLAPWINFPPFNNTYKCLGNGAYYHVGGYDVPQFYVQYATPNGKWTLTAGRYFPLVGYEVTDSWNDAQFSRSILFGFAEPGTHTGVRLAYAWSPHLTLTVGGNNGWDDIVGQAGTLRSLESQIAYTNGNLSATAAYLWGPEYASYGNGSGVPCNVTPTGQLTVPNTCGFQLSPALPAAIFPVVGPIGIRTLFDVQAAYKVFSTLQIGANFDAGSQSNTGPFVTPTSGAIWNGLASYIQYTFPNGKYGLSGRYEFFSDPQGYRTGTEFLFNPVTGTPNLRWYEITGTGIINFSPNVALRGEYRMDYANQPVFTNSQSVNTGTLSRTQGTMSVDLVVKY